MNTSYRSIYNEQLGAWVAVSEISPSCGKKSRSGKRLIGVALAVAALLGSGTASAAFAVVGDGNDINSISIGGDPGLPAEAFGGDSIALGTAAKAGGNQSIAIGDNAQAGVAAKGVNPNYPNNSLHVKGEGAVAIGASTEAFDDATVAIGFKAITKGVKSTAIGEASVADGKFSAVLGSAAHAQGESSTALGSNTVADGAFATAIGAQATATGQGAIAIGQDGAAQGLRSISVGAGNTVAGNEAGAFGVANTVTGNNAYGVGQGNDIGTSNTFVLGSNVKNTVANSVALGDQSAMDGGMTDQTGGLSPVASAKIDKVTFTDFAGSSPAGVVSVGAVGAERRIQNVAAGLVSETSTDAINGSQLYSVAQTPLSFAGNAGAPGERMLGETLQIVGEPTSGGTYTGANLRTEVVGDDTVKIQMTDAPEFESVKTTGAVTVGGALTVNGQATLSGGLNMAGNQIKNVATGIDGTDAVNVDQLNQVSNKVNLGWNVQANSGAVSKIDPGATVQFLDGQNIEISTDPSGTKLTIATADDLLSNSLTINGGPVIDQSGIQMGGQHITNLAPGVNPTDAVNVSQLNQNSAHYVSIASNTASDGNYANDGAKGSDSIAIGKEASTAAAASESVAIGEGASAALANNVALGANSVDGQFQRVDDAVISGFAYNGFAGSASVSGVLSVGQAGGERQIIHVAPGAITASSTDAINGSQLYVVADGLQSQINALGAGPVVPNIPGVTGPTGPAGSNGATGDQGGTGATGADGENATGSVLYTLNQDGSVNYNNVTLNPDGTGSTTISNVGAGVAGTDAVNVDQLNKSTEAAVNKWVTGNPSAYAAPVASGQDASAVGSGALASGESATAVGDSAWSAGNNSVALGARSNDAGRDNVVSVGAVGAERQISNVAPGTQGTDAVNVNQLGAAVTNIHQRIDDVAQNAYAGVAAAMAVQMPGTYVPGKTVMRMGTAVYKGEAALGISFRRTADNNAWSLTGGVGLSRGGTAATVGAEFVFD